MLDELREDGRLSLDTRRSLAGEAFVVTAAYESAISAWFSDRETFPEGLIPTFWRERNLAYGENPHQRAAYYAEAGARRHLLSRSTSTAARSSRTTTSTTSRPPRRSSRSSRCPPA